PRSGMTRGLVFADVRLRLDDATSRDALGGLTLERRAKQLARDNLRGAIVETLIEWRRQTKTPRSRRGVVRHSSFAAAAFLPRGRLAGGFFAARLALCAAAAARRAFGFPPALFPPPGPLPPRRLPLLLP